MDKFCKLLGVFFVTAVGLYLIGVFVSLEPNIFKWDELGRYVMIVLSILGVWLYWFDNYREKQ